MQKTVFIILLTLTMAFPQDLLKLGSSQDLTKAAKRKSLQGPEAPEIEQPVDEATYRVGPGDVFSIIIAGRTDEEDQFMVTPEGTLILPAAGPVPIADLTLQEAKDKIRRSLGSVFLTKDIAVSLVQLRSFRVTVSGSVYYPGLVTVNAMSRVSDAVMLAGGMILPEALQLEPEDTRSQIP
ncbi:MAG: polysaccharide biosynthesis/export family protein, partial [candidate division KSB1 bacterium]|nr:polysaccharide biosynthesis/export family protein [candidate division KSB1 bacterium]